VTILMSSQITVHKSAHRNEIKPSKQRRKNIRQMICDWFHVLQNDLVDTDMFNDEIFEISKKIQDLPRKLG